jgi:hypothetical protein
MRHDACFRNGTLMPLAEIVAALAASSGRIDNFLGTKRR